MGGKQMDFEELSSRRRHQRFSTNETVFIAVRPYFSNMGRIKDISKSGVGFEYTSFDYSENVDAVTDSPMDGHIEIDIFSKSREFHLAKVPCKVVYDMKLEDSFGAGLFENRRCGLEFNHLSNHQHYQLLSLLNRCTGGVVNCQ